MFVAVAGHHQPGPGLLHDRRLGVSEIQRVLKPWHVVFFGLGLLSDATGTLPDDPDRSSQPWPPASRRASHRV